MNVFETHGAFSWCELMTRDAEAAVQFYGKLFGWKFDTSNTGHVPYHVIKSEGAGIGGVMGLPPGADAMPPMWACYVTVDDVDAVMRQCGALGGSVVMPPTMFMKRVARSDAMRPPSAGVPWLRIASGPSFDSVSMMLSAISSRASSQEMRFHLPSPRSPLRFIG